MSRSKKSASNTSEFIRRNAALSPRALAAKAEKAGVAIVVVHEKKGTPAKAAAAKKFAPAKAAPAKKIAPAKAAPAKPARRKAAKARGRATPRVVPVVKPEVLSEAVRAASVTVFPEAVLVQFVLERWIKAVEEMLGEAAERFEAGLRVR